MSNKDVAGNDDTAYIAWLTYRELAAKLGVELASAQRIALQAKWPRRLENDGKPRVGVPQSILADAENDDKPASLENLPEQAAAMLMLQEQLQAALARLDGEVERLRDWAEQAWRDAAEARRETVAVLNRVMVAELEMAKLIREKEATKLEMLSLKGEKKAIEDAVTRIRERGLWARLMNR